MSKQPSVVNRYSDQELQVFKEKIEAKLQEAKEYQLSINEQIDNINETLSEEGDWMDDTASLTDLEMLQMMRHRQQKHIIDLESALQRIHNKSYGICIVSGELIDKKRLLAVPTTTKSMASKNQASTAAERHNKDDDDDDDAPKAPVRKRKNRLSLLR
jgi:RNA polymerase-binding transcription factor DksA